MRLNIVVVILSAIFGVVMVCSTVGCGDMGAPIDENIDQPAEPTPPLAKPVITFEMRPDSPGAKPIDYNGQYNLADDTDYTFLVRTDWKDDEVGITLVSPNCTVLRTGNRSVTFRYKLPEGATEQDVAIQVVAERKVRSPLRYYMAEDIAQAVVTKTTTD